jgi:hypothetical protein
VTRSRPEQIICPDDADEPRQLPGTADETQRPADRARVPGGGDQDGQPADVDEPGSRQVDGQCGVRAGREQPVQARLQRGRRAAVQVPADADDHLRRCWCTDGRVRGRDRQAKGAG